MRSPHYISIFVSRLHQKGIQELDIEKIAGPALHAEVIDAHRYRIVTNWMCSSQKPTVEQIAESLGITRSEVQEKEPRAYESLISYLDSVPAPNPDPLDILISQLPWDDNRANSRARNALTDKFGKESSIRQLVALILDCNSQGRRISISNLGDSGLRATYNALERVNVNTPRVRAY